jgi:hypothetical protein
VFVLPELLEILAPIFVLPVLLETATADMLALEAAVLPVAAGKYDAALSSVVEGSSFKEAVTGALFPEGTGPGFLSTTGSKACALAGPFKGLAEAGPHLFQGSSALN